MRTRRFFGYFGAHNFYLGRTGVAVAQLILTLTILGLFINFFWLRTLGVDQTPRLVIVVRPNRASDGLTPP